MLVIFPVENVVRPYGFSCQNYSCGRGVYCFWHYTETFSRPMWLTQRKRENHRLFEWKTGTEDLHLVNIPLQNCHSLCEPKLSEALWRIILSENKDLAHSRPRLQLLCANTQRSLLWSVFQIFGGTLINFCRYSLSSNNLSPIFSEIVIKMW